MPNAEHFSRFFEILSLGLTVALALRLFLSGLFRSYPVFFSYILFQIFEATYPLLIKNDATSQDYAHIYVYSHWISYLLHILLVAEICRLILARHPGIYSLGKWAIYLGVLISLMSTLLTLTPHVNPRLPQISRILPYYLAAGRSIDFALGIFLLLMLAFMSRFPFRLNRNVVIHVSVYTFFFFATWLGTFAHAWFGMENAELFNLFLTIAACACLLAWLVLLSPDGEQVRSAFPTFTQERETRILEQLDALNATLMRTGRRK